MTAGDDRFREILWWLSSLVVRRHASQVPQVGHLDRGNMRVGALDALLSDFFLKNLLSEHHT